VTEAELSALFKARCCSIDVNVPEKKLKFVVLAVTIISKNNEVTTYIANLWHIVVNSNTAT